MFFCSVIVADDRPHSLHNAVDRKIQESLQFIINAEDHHINLSVGRQDGVEGRDQQRRQRQVQRSRNSDGIQAHKQSIFAGQVLPAKANRYRTNQINDQINNHCQHLTDTRSQSRALNAHGRKRPDSKD